MKYWYLKGEDLFGPAEARDILRDFDFTKDTLVCPEPHCEKQKFWKPAYRYNEDFNFSKEELHDIPQETENGFELEIEDLTKNPLYDSEAIKEEILKQEAAKEESKKQAEDPFVKALSAEEELPAPRPAPKPEEEQNKLEQMLQADEDTLPTAITRDFVEDYGGEISNKTKIFMRSELSNPEEMSQSDKKALDPKKIVLRLMGTVPSRVLDVPATAAVTQGAIANKEISAAGNKPDAEEGTLFTPRPKTLGPVVVTPEKELITEVRALKNKPEDTSSGLIKEGVIKEDDSFEEDERETYISKELQEESEPAESQSGAEEPKEKGPDIPVPTFIDTEGVLVQGGGQEVKNGSSAPVVADNTKTAPSTFSEAANTEEKTTEAFPISLSKNLSEEDEDPAEEEIPHIFDNSGSEDGIFSVLSAKSQKQNKSLEDIDEEESGEEPPAEEKPSSKKVPSTINAVPTINGKIISSFEGHFDSRRPKNDIIYILVLFMALIMGVALFMTFVMQGGKPKKPSYFAQRMQERQKTEAQPQAAVSLEREQPSPEAEQISEEELEINKRSAQNIVKGIALEQEGTSLVAYLDKKYDGYNTEWRADLLHDATYIVEFVARKIRREPVQYIFSVNLKDEKVQGDNTIARELLAKK